MRAALASHGSAGPGQRRARAFRRAAAFAACLLLCAPGAFAADPEQPAASPSGAPEVAPESGEELQRAFDLGFDAVILRPMSLVQLAAGSVMLVPAFVLSLPGGSQAEVLDVLFRIPFDYTFQRPLGEF